MVRELREVFYRGQIGYGGSKTEVTFSNSSDTVQINSSNQYLREFT